MEVADAIIITNQGRIEQTGTPDEICLHPQTEFVADFIDVARYEALRCVKSSCAFANPSVDHCTSHSNMLSYRKHRSGDRPYVSCIYAHRHPEECRQRLAGARRASREIGGWLYGSQTVTDRYQ